MQQQGAAQAQRAQHAQTAVPQQQQQQQRSSDAAQRAQAAPAAAQALRTAVEAEEAAKQAAFEELVAQEAAAWDAHAEVARELQQQAAPQPKQQQQTKVPAARQAGNSSVPAPAATGQPARGQQQQQPRQQAGGSAAPEPAAAAPGQQQAAVPQQQDSRQQAGGSPAAEQASAAAAGPAPGEAVLFMCMSCIQAVLPSSQLRSVWEHDHRCSDCCSCSTSLIFHIQPAMLQGLQQRLHLPSQQRLQSPCRQRLLSKLLLQRQQPGQQAGQGSGRLLPSAHSAPQRRLGPCRCWSRLATRAKRRGTPGLPPCLWSPASGRRAPCALLLKLMADESLSAAQEFTEVPAGIQAAASAEQSAGLQEACL